MKNLHPHDRRDEMPINPNGHAQPFRTADDITHGIIHMTAVEGRTADQHVRFHTAPKATNAAGLFTGRGWRNSAYGSYIGKDARRELLLDLEVVGNHCGNYAMNRRSVGIVCEGRYHLYALPEVMLAAVVAECLWYEAELGRRLIWTWHDVVKPGWNCPGKNFPKAEVLRRIEAHYAEPDGPEPENDGPGDDGTEERPGVEPPVIPAPAPAPEPDTLPPVSEQPTAPPPPTASPPRGCANTIFFLVALPFLAGAAFFLLMLAALAGVPFPR